MTSNDRSRPDTGRRPSSVSLARSAVYFVMSYGVAIAGYFGLNVVTGRFLGTSAYGYFVTLLTVTTLVGQQGLVGLHRAGLREVAQAEDLSTTGSMRTSIRAVMTLALPFVSLATAAVSWFWVRDDPYGVVTAVMSGLLVFLSGAQRLSANFLRGMGHVRYASMMEGRSGGALVSVGQLLCVLLVAWLIPSSGLAGALTGAAVGFVLPLSWAWVLVLRDLGPAPHQSSLVRDLWSVIRRDWKFAVSQTGSYLNSTIDLWMASLLLSAHATSLFAAGQRLAQVLLIPTTSLMFVFGPAIARMLGNGTPLPKLEKLVRTGATFTTTFSAIAWLPMALLPGLVLTLCFGDSFAEAAPVLVLLASGYFLNALTGPSATTLSMSHNEGDLATTQWTAVAGRVVIGAGCALLWGVNGLAAASGAITAAMYVALWWAAHRRLHVSTLATLRPDPSLLRKVSG